MENKATLSISPDLWGALDVIFVEGLSALPYADDSDLAEASFELFDRLPDINYAPVNVIDEAKHFLQNFAEKCLKVSDGLLTADETESVLAFINEA